MAEAHEAPQGTKPFSQRLPVLDSFVESICWTPPRVSLRTIKSKVFGYRVHMLQLEPHALQCLAQEAHANCLGSLC